MKIKNRNTDIIIDTLYCYEWDDMLDEMRLFIKTGQSEYDSEFLYFSCFNPISHKIITFFLDNYWVEGERLYNIWAEQDLEAINNLVPEDNLGYEEDEYSEIGE